MPPPIPRPRVLFIGGNIAWLQGHFDARLHAVSRLYRLEIASDADMTDTLWEKDKTLPCVPVHPVSTPRGMNLGTLFSLAAILRRTKPDLVHLMGSWGIIYGGLLLRFFRHPVVIVSFAGLGVSLAERNNHRTMTALIRICIIRTIFRVVLRRKRMRVILENPDNVDLLSRRGYVRPGDTRLILGAGINLEKYRPSSGKFKSSPPLVLLAARLVRDKGVLEFVEAARLLHGRGIQARFAMLGLFSPDDPGGSITQEEQNILKKEGHVEVWGWRKNMADVLPEATIACLPSYHEGLPIFLVEAAACGVPAVATDIPGCRTAVVNGETGLLVPPQDSRALAAALATLLHNPERVTAMGRAARTRAESLFGDKRVVAETLAVYDELLAPYGT